MSARASSSRLAASAASLGEISSHFQRQATYFGDDLAAAETCLDTVAPEWHGPRADVTLDAVQLYVDTIRPMHDAVMGVGTALSRLAAMADEYAGRIRPHEQVLAAAPNPATALDREAARVALDHFTMEWTCECVGYATAITAATEPLEVAYRAFPSGFGVGEVHGDAYYAALIVFARDADVDLTALGIDDAKLAAISDDLLDFAGSGPLGDLIYTVIETAKDGDISDDNDDVSFDDLDIASSDPERVADLVRQWADDNGITLSEETVSILTVHIMATAAAMKADPNERWRKTDDELDDADEAIGDERALAFLATLPPATAYELARIHSTNPNFIAPGDRASTPPAEKSCCRSSTGSRPRFPTRARTPPRGNTPANRSTAGPTTMPSSRPSTPLPQSPTPRAGPMLRTISAISSTTAATTSSSTPPILPAMTPLSTKRLVPR